MRLLLVDGHYYLYRSFFAIRELSNSRGEPTNAIFGFAKALRKMLTDLKPDYGAVIWDSGLPERRTTLQPAYKQNRVEMPELLRPQERWLQENISTFGVGSLSTPNTEADDLIASYALAAAARGWEVLIATNDKDILQIVTDKILIYSTVKADAGTLGFALLGPAEVRKKWGVDARQIGDVLALTGDTSDNIPGVSGVGAKTAAQLIRDHGTVEKLLAGLDSVKSDTLRDKLEAARSQIVANRSMVALDEDLALPASLDSLRISPRYPELVEALRFCEFKTLLKEVELEASRSATFSQGQLL